jgi:signal peptidase I
VGVKMGNFRRRKPIYALLLSLVIDGLGQMYNGRLKRGIILFLGFYLLMTILLFTGLSFKFHGMILYLAILLVYKFLVCLDAFNGAVKLKEITLKPYNKWYFYLIILISGCIIASFFSSWSKDNFVRAYKIPSSAMEPTLMVGDHLYAGMGIYKKEKPKRGDVIIFEYPIDPSKDFIKRVIGIGGDRIDIEEDKVYINGKQMEDPWGHYDTKNEWRKNLGPVGAYEHVAVPKNHLFVLGDNRDNSQDSRFWGFVHTKNVKGKALYIYWAKNKSRIGMEIKRMRLAK